MEHETTLVDKFLSRLKNNRLTALLIAAGAVVIAIATFTNALTGLVGILGGPRPEDARAELGRLGLEFTPAALVASAIEGDLHAVGLFLLAGMDPNARDAHGRTALMWATAENRSAVVEALLNNERIDAHAESDEGETALSLAAFWGNEEIFEVLLARDFPAQAREEAFVWAAEGAQADFLPLLLEAGVDLDRVGARALLAAVRSEDWEHVTDLALNETVNRLLDLGVAVDAKGEGGWTALLAAADRGRTTVLRRLIDRGADVDVRCDCPGYLDGGWGALMMAIEREHHEIVQILLASGADVRRSSNEGRTPLMEAVEGEDPQLVRALLDQGAQVNAATSTGVTALMRAAGFGTPEIVRLLLGSGADIEARDRQGRRALDHAQTRWQGEEKAQVIALLEGM